MQITHLELPCLSAPSMAAWYGELFDCVPVATDADSVSFRMGWSRVTFRECPPEVFSPQHFAFNIPQNQIQSASEWLASKTTLLVDANGSRIHDFENWRASAVYFRDHEGNNVELIARENMQPHVIGSFHPGQLIGISEIALATEDVVGLALELRRRMAIGPYREVSPDFYPIGTPAGLLIIVPIGRLMFPDQRTIAHPAPLIIRVKDDDGKQFTLKFEGDRGVFIRPSTLNEIEV